MACDAVDSRWLRCIALPVVSKPQNRCLDPPSPAGVEEVPVATSSAFRTTFARFGGNLAECAQMDLSVTDCFYRIDVIRRALTMSK